MNSIVIKITLSYTKCRMEFNDYFKTTPSCRNSIFGRRWFCIPVVCGGQLCAKGSGILCQIRFSTWYLIWFIYCRAFIYLRTFKPLYIALYDLLPCSRIYSTIHSTLNLCPRKWRSQSNILLWLYYALEWCQRWESNPHALRHTILSLPDRVFNW